MSAWAWIVLTSISVVVAIGFAILIWKLLKLKNALQIPTVLDSEPTPCYRCGVRSNSDFMGLRYCEMCRFVIARMLPAVRHDPPFGFPGATGYLEFPEQEKKEESRG